MNVKLKLAKRCSKCKRIIRDFNKSGLCSHCYHLDYMNKPKNKKREKERLKLYYKNNQEKLKSYQRNYYNLYKDKIKLYRNNYYIKNKLKELAQQKKHNKIPRIRKRILEYHKIYYKNERLRTSEQKER